MNTAYEYQVWFEGKTVEVAAETMDAAACLWSQQHGGEKFQNATDWNSLARIVFDTPNGHLWIRSLTAPDGARCGVSAPPCGVLPFGAP